MSMGRKGNFTTMLLPDRYLKNPCGDLTVEEFDRAKAAHDNRQNARLLSTGPRSPEGKAKSAQNARRHGYAGATVVIDEEDREAYNSHLDSYLQTFNPVTQPECDSIRRAAYAQWRYDRLISIETGLLDLDLSLAGPTIDSKVYGDEEHHHRLALEFVAQVSGPDGSRGGSSPLELCRRYLTTAQRDIERSIKFFYFLQKNRMASAPAVAPTATEQPSKQSELPQNQVEPNELARATRKPVQSMENPPAKVENTGSERSTPALDKPKAA
jgi:hypothetical protein